ncbi:hypothetical protein [Thiothrix subterranea]|uniref:Uncharacterized protein n=1 Tax=Thiothrix subterranea TaxID=2735563 RepID=A0AA51MQT8_9GAMM|nr:hypothetical protein [Thiothrix subterranea]MDQ5767961.1 hypothetical protein [Thiothrix subterranea]WML86581.1 hypothetical protein RCG00_20135 [Thiothrix subterranea]
MTALYDLPFDGWREAREYLTRRQAQLAELNQQLLTLQQEFHASFGYSLPFRPIRLADKSYTPLRWRVGTTRRRFELDDAVGQAYLAALSANARRQVLELEFKRIHLNQAWAVCNYECLRLERLLQQFASWRGMMRQLPRSSPETT